MKKYLAEFLGTMVLVLFGCGTAVVCGGFTGGMEMGFLGVVAIALAFGLAIVASAYAIGDISGCHVNPAVSLAMLINGKLTFGDFIGYVIAQVAGAFAGSGILKTHHCQLGFERSRCKRLRQFIRRWSKCRSCIRGRSDFNIRIHHDHFRRYQNEKNRFHCWFGHWSYIDIRSSNWHSADWNICQPSKKPCSGNFRWRRCPQAGLVVYSCSVRRCNSCWSDSQSILCKCRRFRILILTLKVSEISIKKVLSNWETSQQHLFFFSKVI